MFEEVSSLEVSASVDDVSVSDRTVLNDGFLCREGNEKTRIEIAIEFVVRKIEMSFTDQSQ